MTDTQKRDFTLRITQANPVSMITILYEMTDCYLEDALTCLLTQEYTDFAAELHKAQACLKELQNSLHLEYELAKVLFELYILMHKKMAHALTFRKAEPLEEIRKSLRRLIDAYRQLEKTGSWDSVMVNTQQVYAGLTYGKYALNESISGQEGSRGFWV